MTLEVFFLLGLSLAEAPPQEVVSVCRKDSRAKVVSEAKLSKGRWNAQVYDRLQSFAKRYGAQSASYDPCFRPLAVFDFDNTIIGGDLGETGLLFAMRRGFLRADDTLFELVPENARAAFKERWPKTGEVSEDLVEALKNHYYEKVENGGEVEAYHWLTRVFAGHSAIELETFADKLIEEVFRDPARYGLRRRDEMIELIGFFDRAGFDVFVVTASPEWLVRGFAKHIQLPREHVIGPRLVVEKDGHAAPKIDGNFPWRAGKVIAIRTRIPPGGRTPHFVAGDAVGDLEMLQAVTHDALVFDRGNVELLELAKARGWMIQKPFESVYSK